MVQNSGSTLEQLQAWDSGISDGLGCKTNWTLALQTSENGETCKTKTDQVEAAPPLLMRRALMEADTGARVQDLLGKESLSLF